MSPAIPARVGGGTGTSQDPAIIVGTLDSGNGRRPSGLKNESDVLVVDEQNAAAVPMVGALGTGLAHRNRGFAVAHTLRAEGHDASEDGTGRGVPLVADVAPTLRVGGRDQGAGDGPDNTPVVVHAFHSNRGHDGTHENVSPTLRVGSGLGIPSGPAIYACQGTNVGEAGTLKGHNVATGVPFVVDTTQITSATNRSKPKPGDPCHPLAAGAHPPTVAYATQERAESENPDTGPDGAGFRADTAYTLEARSRPQSVTTAIPRRLTPREAERLQAFPETVVSTRIEICHWSELLSALAPVGTPSPSEQRLAGSVGRTECGASVLFAEPSFGQSNQRGNRPVLLNALIDCEHGVLRIHRADGRQWSVPNADEACRVRLPTEIGSIARLGALMTHIEDLAIRIGAVDAPARKKRSSHHPNGSLTARLCGRGIVGRVAAVDASTVEGLRRFTSTTSAHGLSTPAFDSAWTTLCSCAVLAIASSIPSRTPHAISSVIHLEVRSGWTRWGTTEDGEVLELADSPRYKALGNAVTASVARWIGERLRALSPHHTPEAPQEDTPCP